MPATTLPLYATNWGLAMLFNTHLDSDHGLTRKRASTNNSPWVCSSANGSGRAAIRSPVIALCSSVHVGKQPECRMPLRISPGTCLACSECTPACCPWFLMTTCLWSARHSPTPCVASHRSPVKAVRRVLLGCKGRWDRANARATNLIDLLGRSS